MASGGESRLRRAVKRMGFSCTIFSTEVCFRDPRKNISSPCGSPEKIANGEEGTAEGNPNPAKQILCTICLEPLDCKETGEQAVFTAQCMHSFHFTCISSNVRHGSVTCPICRAHWTQLPRDFSPFRVPPCNQASDPILRILDDSIATFRVHRRSSLRSTRYDDDEQVDTDSIPSQERLQMSLVPIPVLPASPETLPNHPLQFAISPSLAPQQNATFGFCLSMKLSQQQATDVVLVVSPNGPHLRLLKQAMFLVVFSLRPPDRLAIVTYSSSATRALPLRRMTSSGKRASLQVINRMFYLGEADPMDGVRKGIKILEDRRHQNPLCCILHLSDGPTRSYISREIEVPIPIHRFHIGFGYGASNEFSMHEFEEFVLRLVGGVVRETQLRIGEQGGLIRIGELRGGEERRIPLGLIGESEYVCVGYSYIEEGVEECLRTGEVLVGFAEKTEQNESGCRHIPMDSSDGRSRAAASRWDYIDPFMARRWARHLHGCRN